MLKLKEYIPESNRRKWFYFALCVLFLFYPYLFVDAFFPFLKSDVYQYLLLLVVLLFLNLSHKGKIKIPRVIWAVLFIMFLGSMASYFANGSKYYYHRLIYMLCAFLLITLIEKKVGLINFFKVYNRWILLMAVLGTIAFFVALVGVPPIFKFAALNDERTVSSWIITFSKQEVLGERLIRYAGFFDEPGAMGYFSMFAIAVNRITVMDRKLEILLIVFTLFCFSMGFISQIMFFLAYFYLLLSNSKTKIVMGVIMTILTIGVYSTKGTQYGKIYDETFGRFETMSEGTEFMEGTTREFNTKLTKEVYERNPIWGIGWAVGDDVENIGDNAYETLAHDGIVGTIYLYSPFIILLFMAIIKADFNLFGVVVFCALSVFHRPIHANLLTYFMIFSMPVLYVMNSRIKQNNISYK